MDLPSNQASQESEQNHQDQQQRHFTSWMFFDGPKDHVHTKEYVNEIHNEENIQHLLELFPQYTRREIIESLQRNHGDLNNASNWLANKEAQKTNSNASRQSSTTSTATTHRLARFACGNCSTILSISIPSSAGHDQITSICPTCGIENVIPTESLTNSSTNNNPQPHYSSWMFYNNSDGNQNINTTYSHTAELNNEDINKIMELFPECNRVQVEEALRVAHGDADLACNWILAHNEYPESSGPSVTYYHPPVPVACVINDRTALIESGTLRVSCGNCRNILSVILPTTPIQPGSQLSGQCPQCGMTNIIPLRKMSRAVIF